MNMKEILLGGGGALLVLMTLVQIAPIKINPWSSLARTVGRAVNGEVLKKLDVVKTELEETKENLDSHIRIDDERNADMHRARILQFNTELLRDIRHTEEDFNEILYNIDCYERYCEEHSGYRNNRCVHAIKNIKRVFDERMEKRDFL